MRYTVGLWLLFIIIFKYYVIQKYLNKSFEKNQTVVKCYELFYFLTQIVS